MNKKKTRQYKAKGKAYIEAKYLKDFGFDKGQNIIYKINKKNKTCKIKAVNFSNSFTKKVYKTTGRTGEVPVIDIRTNDIKEFFNGHDNIELTIVKGLIIFRVKEAVKSKGLGKIVSFKKKTQYYSVSAKKLAKAVNADQMSFFDLFSHDFTEDTSSSEIESTLEQKKIKLISLFSGAGMLDKGFLDNGNFDITFAVDMHEKKRLKSYHIDTYKNNIGDHIIEKNVLELTKEDVGLGDFVIGGIPCVKFSKLNTKDNFRNNNDEHFPLLEKFMDVVEWSNAKGFLIENVKEFISVKNGALLKRIQSRLSDFNITYKIIDSSQLGSPQARKRSFILGFKNVIPEINLPKVQAMKTVRDAFKGVENAPQHDLRLELKGKYLEMAQYVPQGGNGNSVPEHLRPNRKFDNFIQRLHYDKQAPTVTGIDSDYILHPEEDRKPSVREIARLFSLPDDFLFHGSVTSIVTQLKNGVDYKVSSFFANIIANQLLPVL